jgi:hypothetical protein
MIRFIKLNSIACIFAVSSFILSGIFNYKILYLIGWCFVCIQIVCALMVLKKEMEE